MPTNVMRADDYHNETAGTTALGPIPHPFVSSPAATQSVLVVDGEAVLRRGDEFDDEGSGHARPQAGTGYVNASGVTGKGRFTEAGQAVLFIDDQSAMCMGGRLQTCSDGAREAEAEATITLTQTPVLFLDGQPVLPGCN
jgi:hypothetical protein